MDLLEYQGKQLFMRHGIPVPRGAVATSVEEAVQAADIAGYPCVVKAQVQIGGRGKLGGIKLAADRVQASLMRRRSWGWRSAGGLGRAGLGDQGRVLCLDRL